MNVKFLSVKLKSTFDALETKDNLALYWIDETQELYKGSKLYGTGALATESVAGLLSPEDYAALKALIASGAGNTLTAVDSTIVLSDTDSGKTIGVAISAQEGNTLVAVEDGLFVPHAQEVIVPEYAIEKQETASEGFAATYKLKRTLGDEATYVGDEINIAKDLVLKTASMQTVAEDNVPYDGAKIGDPYIDMEFNDEAATHLYIPMKGLVDAYSAGDGIEIIDNKISVKIAENSHGLVAVDGALLLNLATAESDGAMSKEDKAFIDAIPTVYAGKDFVKKTAEQVKYEIADAPYGTIVNYGENEIRIMCPANAEFVKQNVGVGGDANSYYVTFKTYAPNDSAVGYIEHLGDQVDGEILTSFSTDEYGRRYQPTWLAVAKYDETTGTWTYYGKNSSEDKYIGWDYQIDWFDENGVMISTDSIRINLSNEDCHNSSNPYYMANYATVEQIDSLRDEVSGSMSWGEL